MREAALLNRVEPPELSDERLAQIRAHLLAELERESRMRERRARLRSVVTGRRRVLVVVAAVLGVVYAVPAVAQERWWWVSSPDDPMQPVTQVVTMGPWTAQELLIYPDEGSVPTARVATRNERWIVQAYVGREDQVCVGISPDPPRPANEGAGIGCGFPVHGMAPAGIPTEKLHWVGFVTGIPGKVSGSSPKFMFGPATANVRSVDLENNDGRVIRVPTRALPASLGVHARFWIVVLPIDHLVHTVVPRDEGGKALEHWRLPIAQ